VFGTTGYYSGTVGVLAQKFKAMISYFDFGADKTKAVRLVYLSGAWITGLLHSPQTSPARAFHH